MLFMDPYGNACEYGDGVWVPLPDSRLPDFAKTVAKVGDSLALTELEAAIAEHRDEIVQKAQALGAEAVQAADAA